MKKQSKPGDMFNKFQKKKMMASVPKAAGGVVKAAVKARESTFKPYYGGFGGKMSNGAGWGGEKNKKKKGKKKLMKTKPQGKGIVKALGQKGTTGNFKKIEKKAGKGAAIAALQNKLAKRRGKPIPFKKKKMGKDMEC